MRLENQYWMNDFFKILKKYQFKRIKNLKTYLVLNRKLIFIKIRLKYNENSKIYRVKTVFID